jgi:hypothetical protein
MKKAIDRYLELLLHFGSITQGQLDEADEAFVNRPDGRASIDLKLKFHLNYNLDGNVSSHACSAINRMDRFFGRDEETIKGTIFEETLRLHGLSIGCPRNWIYSLVIVRLIEDEYETSGVLQILEDAVSDLEYRFERQRRDKEIEAAKVVPEVTPQEPPNDIAETLTEGA